MDILERYLEQLNQEIAGLTGEIAAVNEQSPSLTKDLLNATDPQQRALLEKVWESKERLVANRQALQDTRGALLAKLPTPGDVLSTRKAEEQLQAIFDIVQEERRGKSTVSISSVKTDTWVAVQSTAKLSIRIVEDLPASSPKEAVVAFDWDGSVERAQADRYMAHLQEIISLDNGNIDWVDANHHSQLLSYNGVETLGRNFRGTTDVLIADSSAIRARQPGRGMRVLFELKKKVENSHIIQAQISLLLANVLCPESKPVMVLTDLRDEWHLFWLDGATINQHVFISRGRAVSFIEDLLAGRVEASEDLDRAAVPVSKRRKIFDRLVSTFEVENTLTEDQLQSLEGVLAPSDLSQMRAHRLIRQLETLQFAPNWRPVPDMYT